MLKEFAEELPPTETGLNGLPPTALTHLFTVADGRAFSQDDADSDNGQPGTVTMNEAVAGFSTRLRHADTVPAAGAP